MSFRYITVHVITFINSHEISLTPYKEKYNSIVKYQIVTHHCVEYRDLISYVQTEIRYPLQLYTNNTRIYNANILKQTLKRCYFIEQNAHLIVFTSSALWESSMFYFWCVSVEASAVVIETTETVAPYVMTTRPQHA